MRLRIQHNTKYRFGEPVRYGLQQLRKTPKSSHGHGSCPGRRGSRMDARN